MVESEDDTAEMGWGCFLDVKLGEGEEPSDRDTLKDLSIPSNESRQENLPRISRATYKAPTLVVPSMMAVEIAFRPAANQRPCLRPNLALRGPTSNEETKVPIVIKEEINC